MFFKDKKLFVFKCILVLIAAIAAGRIVISNYQWKQNENIVPAVVSGHYVVFSEELSSTTKINKIEATEQSIFYLYPGLDVVAAYDWTGTYQYSLAFYRANNGVLQMRCDNGLLYISDRESYEYVFFGNELLYKFEPTDTTHTHPMAWFNQEPETSLTVVKNTLYSTSGKRIMQIPGVLY